LAANERTAGFSSAKEAQKMQLSFEIPEEKGVRTCSWRAAHGKTRRKWERIKNLCFSDLGEV